MPDSGQVVALVNHLRAAQRGDRTACEMLLGELHFPILQYVRRKVATEPDAQDVAEDIVQETLLRVAIHLENCRAQTDTELLGWTLAIARNVWIDYRRTPGPGVFRLRPSDEDVAARQEPQARSWADRILGRLFRAALASLPGDTVRILRLRGVEDATWAEIAREVGIAPTAAKRRFQRAQVRLRREVLRRVGELPLEQRKAVLRRLPRDSL